MLISSYMKCESIVYFGSTVIRDVSFVLSIVVVAFSIMFLRSPLLLMRFVFSLTWSLILSWLGSTEGMKVGWSALWGEHMSWGFKVVNDLKFDLDKPRMALA
jgi:hypothetical protein